MPVPHISTNFSDALDIRFHRILDEEYEQLPDMISTLYNQESSNGRNDMRWSQVGTLGDFSESTGSGQYQSQSNCSLRGCYRHYEQGQPVAGVVTQRAGKAQQRQVGGIQHQFH